MKILCVCQYGAVRSNGMAFILKNNGHEAIAIGYETTKEDTIKMLIDWADLILVAEQNMIDKLPKTDKKIVDTNIGPDSWGFDMSNMMIKEIRGKVIDAIEKSVKL